jgi:predicted Zn-dependent peptidase
MIPRTRRSWMRGLAAAIPAVALALATGCGGGYQGGGMASGEEIDRSIPPPLGELGDLSFPDYKETFLDNGLELVVVEHHEQPLVTVNLTVKTGGSLDPEGKAGLSNLAAELLNKGTETRTADEIAEQIEFLGGNLSAYSSDDVTTVQVSVLSEHLEKAMEILADVARNPVFPEDELETARKRAISALQVELSQPEAMASRHFNRIVYGPHPYAKAPTEEAFESLTREDMVAFHERNFVSNNAILGAAGDVDDSDFEKLARKYFGTWERGDPQRPEYEEPPSRDGQVVYLFDKPGAVQSVFRVGYTTYRPGNPDIYGVRVMNRVLGEGSASRLFEVLRQDKGWTYGAYSSFSNPVDLGSFRETMSVRTEVTDSAYVELMNQFEKIRRETVPPDELKDCKAYLTGNFPRTIETPTQILGQVISIKLRGYDKEYLDNYRANIAKVDAATVQEMARKHIRPGEMAVVIVGNASEIREKLEAVAPRVELFDIEGDPISADALEVTAVHHDYALDRLTDEESVFKMTVQGMELGAVKNTLKKEHRDDGDVYVMGGSCEGMLTFNSSMTFSDDFRPLSRTMKMSSPMAMSIDLSYDGGKVTGEAQLPQQGEKEVDQELVEGTLDSEMLELALRMLDLEEGADYTFPVYDVQGGGLVNAHTEVLGVETIEVPAGTFDTYKVEVQQGGQRYQVFLEVESPHRLVKTFMMDQGLTMERIE